MVARGWRRFSFFALYLSPFSQAQPIFEPLWVENLSPLAALVGLPSQRSADIREGVSVTLHSDVATHFVSQADGDESVFFDGETQRHSLRLRWGFSPFWELSAVVPVTKHSGGFTDGYVNRWHDFFGMPDGGRRNVPNDELRHQFIHPSQQVGLVEAGSGLGDTTF